MEKAKEVKNVQEVMERLKERFRESKTGHIEMNVDGAGRMVSISVGHSTSIALADVNLESATFMVTGKGMFSIYVQGLEKLAYTICNLDRAIEEQRSRERNGFCTAPFEV